MKELILNLKKDRLAFIFAILGIVLIAVPAKVVNVLPYVMGISMIVYSIANIIITIKFPDAETKLGNSILRGVLGVVILLQKSGSIATMGVIWAVLSLQEAAEEVNEVYKTKKFHAVSAVGVVISVVLAAMLMLDPFEHFTTHVRILGLEMLSSVFIRRFRLVRSKNEESV